MKLSDFNYPAENQIIAQTPSFIRDRSRLMVLHRKTGQILHRTFEDLLYFLDPGSVLVLNDSKVFPARLRGMKESGGKTEILLLGKRAPSRWEVLLKGTFRKDQNLFFRGGLAGRLVESLEDGRALIEFKGEDQFIQNHFLRYGEVPLPPYIKRGKDDLLNEDRENYQTVYAKSYGSVAAPTAGLHFTPSLLNRIQQKGIEIVAVTLHVGPGTFKGIAVAEIENHRMDPESYLVSEESVKTIRLAKSEKRKIIAVGTTSARVLETISTPEGEVIAGNGSTDLFIFPGYSFKIVDALVTNFHLPKSTLLMLTAAFSGREQLLTAYGIAIQESYRFYSYGDAMFIL